MSDAFLLGAGFSRAISPVMPTTNELGNHVITQQKSIHASKTTSHSSICDGLSCDWPVLPREFPDIDFEGWLSELGEPQPYLFGPENDRRRALFDELAGLIRLQVNFAEEHATLGRRPPQWLVDLILYCHSDRAVAVTLNYDTLIEATFDGLRLPDPKQGGAHPITHLQVGPSVIPNWDVMYGGLRLQPADTLQLVKLHGSTNWFWDGSTRSAASMVQIELRTMWEALAPSYSEEDLDFRVAGKVPVIVPPTFGKSSLLDNPTIQHLWRSAYLALTGARRIFVIGFSLPPSDRLMRSMLKATVANSEVWIVNPDPTVGDRFTSLSAGSLRLDFCGPEACNLERFSEYLKAEV